MPSLIDAYLAEFDRHLAFDRRLAARVREEIGSHLAEALEHETSEVEAVARFGDPKHLSKAFVEAALAQRLHFTAASLAIMAMVTFALMRLRSVWFDLAAHQQGLSAYMTALDRTGFSLGLLMGGYAIWRVRKLQPNIEHALIALHGATVCFGISIVASVARALSVAGSDGVIWLTGVLEGVAFVVICWQLRLTYRHAVIAQSPL